MLKLVRVPGNEYLIMHAKGFVVRLKFGHTGEHDVEELAKSIFDVIEQSYEVEEQEECPST